MFYIFCDINLNVIAPKSLVLVIRLASFSAKWFYRWILIFILKYLGYGMNLKILVPRLL